MVTGVFRIPFVKKCLGISPRQKKGQNSNSWECAKTKPHSLFFLALSDECVHRVHDPAVTVIVRLNSNGGHGHRLFGCVLWDVVTSPPSIKEADESSTNADDHQGCSGDPHGRLGAQIGHMSMDSGFA